MTQPPVDAVRASALELLAVGNSLGSVAHVLGVPVDAVREWAAQPATPPLAQAMRTTERARSWLHFPGTVVYPTGWHWAIIATGTLVSLLAVVSTAAWRLAFFTSHGDPTFVTLSVLIALVCLAAAIQSTRVARVNRFEMRPDAIARYTLAGCTVLPYADIIGLTAAIEKGFYSIQFLTRTGVLMTIRPRFSQLEDERLLMWLQAIPKRDGRSIQRISDR